MNYKGAYPFCSKTEANKMDAPFDWRNPTTKDFKQYFGYNTRKIFVSEFEERCWGSPNFAESTYYTVIGQLEAFRDTKLYMGKEDKYQDGRNHTLLFQISSTGKTEGIRFAEMVINQLGLSMISPDKFSDAVLIGGLSQEGKKKRFIKGYLDPTRKNSFRFLTQDEASGLMLSSKGSDYKQDYLVYYQKAMDAIGKNTLSGGTLGMEDKVIKINPVLSFLLTTVPPENLSLFVATMGILQRTDNLYNPKDLPSLISAWDKLADSYFTIDNAPPDASIEAVVAVLKYINYVWYPSQINAKRNIFKLDPAIKKQNAIKTLRDQYIVAPIKACSPTTAEVLYRFPPRLMNRAMLFAKHNAMMRLSWTITMHDLMDAYNQIASPWARMVQFVENSSGMLEKDILKNARLRNKLDDTIKFLSENEYKHLDGIVPLKKVVSIMSKDSKWGVSDTTVRNRIDSFVKQGFYVVLEEKIGNRQMNCIKRM